MLSSHCENMLAYAAAAGRRAAVLVDQRRYRPNVEVAPNCPRCDSPNTKFCYYNNYSLSQPRYFCKGCRRYWTKGGSLRNVPVGGGCRKNRRGKSVRSMVDTAAASGGAGAAAFSHRFHGPVRPDLLLEGMVGNPAGLVLPAPDDKPDAAPDGSTIDLALLYAKFLNHQPLADGDAEQCAAEPETADASNGSSDHMSPGAPPPAASCPDHDGFGECAQALGELNFSVDQSCFDSLGMPTDGGDLILPSTWGQDAKYVSFDSLPGDAMNLHDGSISGGDDVWSSALGCQGLEAALCMP